MDYYAINSLRENHAGWSLLRAQNAPLAVSFFITALTGPNQELIRWDWALEKLRASFSPRRSEH